MHSQADSSLIFDLSMHRSLDTDFYLRQGFRVLALEANPDLWARCREQYAVQIAGGQLTIVEAALSDRDGKTVAFFLNPEKDECSSTAQGWAEKGGQCSNQIRVASITLNSLFGMYGARYDIKCDIEGADLLVTEQARDFGARPAFVSVEAIAPQLLEHLRDAGFQRFAIVNQALKFAVQPPNPPREGKFAAVKFNGHMSGLFGGERPAERWLDIDECLSRYNMFRELKKRDESLARGWRDFHASREIVPGGGQK